MFWDEWSLPIFQDYTNRNFINNSTCIFPCNNLKKPVSSFTTNRGTIGSEIADLDLFLIYHDTTLYKDCLIIAYKRVCTVFIKLILLSHHVEPSPPLSPHLFGLNSIYSEFNKAQCHIVYFKTLCTLRQVLHNMFTP